MLSFKNWLIEANLSLPQFMKRISSNLNAIFKKIKNEEMFETETGSPIKLSGLAIKEKGAKKPIVYLANKFNQESWVDSISNFIEDPDFDAINNLFVILDDGNITPTLKPIRDSFEND